MSEESEEKCISFELLYSEDKDVASAVFLAWCNSFIRSYVPEEIKIRVDFDRLTQFINSLTKKPFPAANGYENASPFKKAAFIYVNLLNTAPFSSPQHMLAQHGQVLVKFEHSMATVLGYNLVKHCLWNAKLSDGLVLEKQIKISEHYFHDLIDAASQVEPDKHFKTYSLLFEALVYLENDPNGDVGISYQRTV